MNRKGSAQTCPVGCCPSSSLPSLLLQAEGKTIVDTRLSLAYLLCTSSVSFSLRVGTEAHVELTEDCAFASFWCRSESCDTEYALFYQGSAFFSDACIWGSSQRSPKSAGSGSTCSPTCSTTTPTIRYLNST